MKDFINALKDGKGYDWICQHGHELNKYELIDIVKEYDYSICHMDQNYEKEEYGAKNIYKYAAEQLDYLYQEE